MSIRIVDNPKTPIFAPFKNQDEILKTIRKWQLRSDWPAEAAKNWLVSM
jgi:hypothetical protein